MLASRYRFVQGQFLTLRTFADGAELRRSYSICSAVGDADLRVAIKRVPDGVFSSWAHRELVAGRTIDVGVPDGRFHVALDPNAGRHYLAIAAGSGITPILSTLKTALAAEPHSRFTLVYGNRSSSSVMFRGELQALKDRYLERLAILYVMSREAQDVEVLHGRIDASKCEMLLRMWIDASTVDVAFVCGPQDMAAAVVEVLRAHGLPAGSIKTESFGAGALRSTRAPRVEDDAASACVAYAILDGQRRTFTIDRGVETILEAGLRQGLDLPYSCKGGVCSTCRVVLVEGEVEMDVHYALEDYEIARGAILTCQSHPVTGTIGIDVDGRSHV